MTTNDHDHIVITEWTQLRIALPIRIWCDWCEKRHHTMVGNYLGNKLIKDINNKNYKSKAYDVLPNCPIALNKLTITERSIDLMHIEECMDPIMEKEREKDYLIRPLLSVRVDGLDQLERIAA